MSSTTMSRDITWQYPKPFTQELTVLPEHTDRLGHTNNVRYLEWLEQAAWSHIESLGYGWNEMETSGKALAITRTEIEYLLSSYASDTLLIGTWISSNDERFKCGRKFQVFRASDAKLILRAEMDFACINLKNGRPAKMPSPMIDALNAGLLSQ